MDYVSKKITLDDGKTYFVVEQVELNGRYFLYLVNKEDEKDVSFVEIKNDEILDIDEELFTEEVFPLFMDKMGK